MSKKRNPADKIAIERSKNEIYIKGARANNLKNISVTIPRNQMVVVTGVSGSGKSSLTIDTLFAEGQRRYVESLSSYARQFLMRMKKPDVDFIKGICPAIAIEQKVSTRNARSTVGSLTEIYDYLRLLYARIGKTFSPVSGELVKKHEVTDVVDFIHTHNDHAKIQIVAPVKVFIGKEEKRSLEFLLQKGYTRLLKEGQTLRIEELLDGKFPAKKKDEPSTKTLHLLIDRFVVNHEDEDNKKRIADSIQVAFGESGGECLVFVEKEEPVLFNNRFELDGMEFEVPTPHLFNYNNPYGACRVCEGYGKIIGIDEDKVIPNKKLSVYEGAVQCWKGEKGRMWLDHLIQNAHHVDFPVHTPYRDLSASDKKILWKGSSFFDGITDYFSALEEKLYKIQNRVMLARYRGKTKCYECDGKRLRTEATYVKIDGKDITQLVDIPIRDLAKFFEQIELNEYDETIAKRIITEVTSRLDFMINVGLGYLTLSRLSSTLSGGETQRINLTRTLGSNLTSSMYILDEPSIGLHPRDTDRLVKVLHALRDLGNTVVVVEHEEDIIANSDYLIDIGPAAGIHGGEVVFAGPFNKIYDEAGDSLTAQYMNGSMKVPVPVRRRKGVNKLFLKGARHHNLQDIDVEFPLNTITAVTGVSGSGKTTLVKQILYPLMKDQMGEPMPMKPGEHDKLEGDLKVITQVEMVNQSPIGKSSRSNPVTYVKAYDAIRKLFADQQLSKIRGFKPKHFSFNVEGGRCETCKGEGEIVVEMQFLADVRLVCDECEGKRFKDEVLDVHYKGKSIFEVLDLSIEEALDFFSEEKDILKKLKPLHDVGLGYVKLGQSSSTLSGGEAQRVKLASFLGRENPNEHALFIFDEPTTGLHFHDIRKLLDAFNALVEKGHTVIVIEHNLEVIKNADWVIDLGPGGGDQGGKLVFQGTPEAIIQEEGSFTGQFLKEKM
ncbi:MAG: excinuclease ABC subunit UvrA [Bacteroidota bacterium]